MTTKTATITFNQNVTENDTLTVTKSGNTVCINGRVKIIATLSGLAGLLFTLPSGFRPTGNIRVEAVKCTNLNGNVQPGFGITVKSNGDVVTTESSSNINANAYMTFAVSYNI